MKFACYGALALLALWDLPALWREGKRRELAGWLVLGAFAAGLIWLNFWVVNPG